MEDREEVGRWYVRHMPRVLRAWQRRQQRQLASELRRRERASREKLFQVPRASDVPAASYLTYPVCLSTRHVDSLVQPTLLASGKKGMPVRPGFFLPATSAPSTIIVVEREWPIAPSDSVS